MILCPVTGSSSSVHVSWSSRRRRVTRNGTGAIGPGASWRSVCAVVAIYVQEPHPRPLEPLDHHLCETGHQVVAETRVCFALAAQTGAVEARRPHERERAHVEVPAVRREEPRPADNVARLERLDRDGAAGRNERLQRDAAVPQHVEHVCRVAVADDQLVCAELHVRAATRDQRQVGWLQALEPVSYTHLTLPT